MRLISNALKQGARIRDFEIVGILGAGGFGTTYKTKHTNLKRAYAIKEYFPTSLAARMPDGINVAPVGSEAKFDYHLGLQRFISEARTLNYLRHPNIVSVVDCLEENNTAYMVMEFEEGESLGAILGLDGKLSEKITSSFLYPLLDGLEAVHDAQFIHRDIKPANIFIRESGSPILLDFGGARQILGRRRQTLSSMVSDGYAPIEQYQPGGQLGEWTDIYGVGAVLYHCAVGSSPIAAPDRQTEIIRNGRDPLIPPSELAHDYYSADFLCGIEQGLQLDIEQRPQNIAAWKNFLSS